MRERERENSLKRVYKKNGIEKLTTYYKKIKVHCIFASPSPQNCKIIFKKQRGYL